MQATLFRARFPPPSSCAAVFAGMHGPSARRAADTRVSAVMQGVVRNVASSNICPDILGRPVEQWIDFQKAVRVIPGFEFKCLPRCRLLPPKPGNPALLSRQRAF